MMKIEIESEQMATLFRSGLIHPSDVKCLDSETKQALKGLCLDLCKPDQCKDCCAQGDCQQEVSRVHLSPNIKGMLNAN